jgi:hypothetical protein
VRKALLTALALLVLFAVPCIKGSGPLRSLLLSSGSTTLDGKSNFFDLDRTSELSLGWSVTSTASVLVELGIPDNLGGTHWITPSMLNPSQANPLVLGSAGDGLIELELPVAKSARLSSIASSATGFVVLNAR